jgi:MFS transporter, DHA2 family, multidrug resistance protein
MFMLLPILLVAGGYWYITGGHVMSTDDAYVEADNRMFEDPDIARFWNPATDAGRAALDAVVTQQSQIIAYSDDFKLLMVATLVVFPLLAVFNKPADRSVPDHLMAME